MDLKGHNFINVTDFHINKYDFLVKTDLICLNCNIILNEIYILLNIRNNIYRGSHCHLDNDEYSCNDYIIKNLLE